MDTRPSNLSKLNELTPFASLDKAVIGNNNHLSISNIGHSTLLTASQSLMFHLEVGK